MISNLILALMHAMIFGNVSAIIPRLYSHTTQYHTTTMSQIQDFVWFYQIPYPLREKLKDYAQYDYSYSNGINMDEVGINLRGRAYRNDFKCCHSESLMLCISI